MACLLLTQEAGEQDLINAAAETLFTVDGHDRDALVIALAELCVLVDVDQARGEAVPLERVLRLVAQVAAVAGVENNFRHRCMLLRADG